jgi:hypothetical protein
LPTLSITKKQFEHNAGEESSVTPFGMRTDDQPKDIKLSKSSKNDKKTAKEVFKY